VREDLFLVAFPVLFLAMWTTITVGLARAGGWHALAQQYAATGSFAGRRFRFCSARLGRGVSYNGVLIAGADPFGLYLAVWPFFRLGHHPLFVHWTEVHAVGEASSLIPVVVMTFARAPGTRMRITRRLAEKLAAETRGGFRIDDPAHVG
jgi:hypothetical protein